MRVFVAIDLGTTQGADPPPAPDHLTLRFVGEVDEAAADSLARALAPAVASLPAFELTLEGVGAFPGPRAPRVVWVGVTRGHDATLRLAAAVSEALVLVGFPRPDGTFVPHVTLWRVRSPADRERARRLLDGREPAPAARAVRVDEVVLKESVLAPTGAVHRTRARFPLARTPGTIDSPAPESARSVTSFRQR
ncbi:MAG: RNA 2',3'-cyclic phosphodiesterase [Thermoplasmata archaeon]